MNNIKIECAPGVFSVDNLFVDDFIKDANGSFIKVYIYFLRHAQARNSVSLEQAAKDTGLIMSDVVDALKYWDGVGVVKYKNDDGKIELLFCRLQSKDVSVQGEAEEIKPQNVHSQSESVSSSYRAKEVITTVTQDKKLVNLFNIIQQILNKSLNSNDYKIIYSFIDYLKLPEQVIIILFEYCVSISKTNMRYIEKIAYSWADKGIDTTDLAMKYVKDRTREKSVLSDYKLKFKISGREFSDSESEFIMKWINEYKATEKTILSAFDKAVLNTGKISFKYMDAIIRSESKSVNGGIENSSNVKNSKFRNCPSKYPVSDSEKKMIDKMMAEYEGGADNAVDG